ncbi:MAG: hypothetical protein U0360_05700 [Dehalococcoidia bacterium]
MRVTRYDGTQFASSAAAMVAWSSAEAGPSRYTLPARAAPTASRTAPGVHLDGEQLQEVVAVEEARPSIAFTVSSMVAMQCSQVMSGALGVEFHRVFPSAF